MKIVLNDAFFDKKTGKICVKLLREKTFVCFIMFLAQKLEIKV